MESRPCPNPSPRWRFPFWKAREKLSWDDPVYHYFPRFRVPGAARDAVTLRTLANHTSGIPPMEPLEWSIAMNSAGREGEWVRAMRKSAPNAMETIDQVIDYIATCPYPTVGAPGENMSYCNEGYAILSYVADQAAGVPLEQFCMERIFRPLGMTRTIMDDDCASARALSGGNITSLFERDEDGTLRCDDNWSVLPPFRGCAMVKSTARDMAVYYRCLASGGIHEGRQVLPRAAVDAMIGPPSPLRKSPAMGWGFTSASSAATSSASIRADCMACPPRAGCCWARAGASRRCATRATWMWTKSFGRSTTP